MNGSRLSADALDLRLTLEPLVWLPNNRFFDINHKKNLENSRAQSDCKELGAAFSDSSLSNVPKQAASLPDAKIAKTEPTFHVSLGLMRSRVRVRAESPGVRDTRMYHGMSFSRRSQRFVNRRTGAIISLNLYLRLGLCQRLYEPLSDSMSTTRGEITGFSDKSRGRLLENAHEITAELKERGIKPGFMLTLTYPGDWRSVAPDGRAVKRHLDKIERRLKRYFKRLQMSFSALWFLEFQKRGAPHFHLILWGENLKLTEVQYRQAQTDLRTAWCEVVGHSDPVQRERHRRRGVGFERMRKGHLGYAAKYAKKMNQKTVPDEFKNVGRFWGFWNYKTPVPDALNLTLTHAQIDALTECLQLALFKTSSTTLNFVNQTVSKLGPRYDTDFDGNITNMSEVNCSFTAFGELAVKAVWDWIGAGFKYEGSHTASG